MHSSTPIAVVGMGALFPKAVTLADFWRNICNKVVAISDPPPGRWALDPEHAFSPKLAADHVVSTQAGFLDEFTLNPHGLHIEPALLAKLDPLYHLVLHAARQAFHAAVVDSLDRDRVGVVLASIALPTQAASEIADGLLTAFFEESLFGRTAPPSEIFARLSPLNSRVTALPGALVAQGLGLGGGSYTLDAACASSLYALKFACDELRAGRADAMLAGGASRPDSLYTQMGFSQLRALSPSGRCSPFDAAADGLVVGEGAGFLMLKRLDDALRDTDDILALVHAAGLSNDIGGNLLAPDAEGQVRAMTAAYRQAGWNPHDVDLIECHGTGTPLGDAVEIKSMKTHWGSTGWKAGQCAIGSVKSMIGHLLTGAGMASLIKTILALRHQMLPPSANFDHPGDGIELADSPFRVQTEADHWPRRNAHTPRRAGVSGFGFGGINGHVLLEEWDSTLRHAPSNAAPKFTAENVIANTKIETTQNKTAQNENTIPVAVVGMDARFGSARSLREFEKLVFSQHADLQPRPADRGRGLDARACDALGQADLHGAYLDELSIPMNQFRIPPNEIPEILPQQLLMLQSAAAAFHDADLSDHQRHPRVSVIVGMGFDFETTGFHYRWVLPRLARRWADQLGLHLSEPDFDRWVDALREAAGPPLNPTRTVGALGNMLASRIAKEFRLGGPSFAVSAEETSGLRAIELAVRALQRGEIDAALAGSVDLTGDLRAVFCNQTIEPFSKNDRLSPFGPAADGTLPGEGAACVVLKRLDDAVNNGDRIYSIIRGFGIAGNGTGLAKQRKTYDRALMRAYHDANVSRETIGFLETHGSGNPGQDRIEATALAAFFANRSEPAAIGSVKPHIGHTGAAAGLASFVKTCLCLHRAELAPMLGFTRTNNDITWPEHLFHVPRRRLAWLRDRSAGPRHAGPRRAGLSAMSLDGNCMHIVLEEHVSKRASRIADTTSVRPAGHAVFAIHANDIAALRTELDALASRVDTSVCDLPNLAAQWHAHSKERTIFRNSISIYTENADRLRRAIAYARHHLQADPTQRMQGQNGVFYSPDPLGRTGRLAFVFPGSGNHFVGMGSDLALHFPDVLRRLDDETEHLASQLMSRWYAPYRNDWTQGWPSRAAEALTVDPHRMIFGQVAFGVLASDVLRHLGIEPSAVIGYSLGESAGLFALRAWKDRDEMFRRMEASTLFRSVLFGPCHAARTAWSVRPDQEVDFQAVLVNRPADDVRRIVDRYPTASLLIVNTPDECVLGGRRGDVQAAVADLRCEFVPLEGVPTVHCDVVRHVADEYRQLHLHDTTPPDGIRFYSGHAGRAYSLTRESAADAILNQALHGFDFPRTINQAYEDGVRIFVEVGPQASCTRMIGKIFGDRSHVARSASGRSEDELAPLFKLLAALIAEGVPVNLDRIHPRDDAIHVVTRKEDDRVIRVPIGGKQVRPVLPAVAAPVTEPCSGPLPDGRGSDSDGRGSVPMSIGFTQDRSLTVAARINASSLATIESHETFLRFSARNLAALEKSLVFQTRMMGELAACGATLSPPVRTNGGSLSAGPAMPEVSAVSTVAFPREKCLEFARGSIANVLGPDFAPVDEHPTRVRLPDEPLMLVDRILTVEGQPRSLGGGRVVTEHDVLDSAWYLDTDRAPTGITVEAGQADLFLSAYLGVDFVTKGLRVYRLLDATVTFHRGLPRVGETIRYDIRIDRFIRQGDTHLFFFHFVGTIDGQTVLTMTDGCAGFFTHEEIEASGGILLGPEDLSPPAGRRPEDWRDFAPVTRRSFDDHAINDLRRGDLAGCFGPAFAGLSLNDPPGLPDGTMKLIDRVVDLDPNGGRYGLGRIIAEADVQPDDWYLTCHFVDDMVMPGTLMYEYCMHTLRVFLLQMGWVADQNTFAYEPVPGVSSSLRCRGPVTTRTRKVTYQIDIKEIGYRPEPYVLADALMSADDRPIVFVRDMSVQLTGLTRGMIEKVWNSLAGSGPECSSPAIAPVGNTPVVAGRKPAVFSQNRILAFAIGKPSEAFGEQFRIFDQDRRIARLPGPPYMFLDRITEIHTAANVLEPGGWIESQYDLPVDAWYFRANRQRSMPFSILLEIALQPCGWLAAYLGSALTSASDLVFRNLGGTATLYREIFPEAGTLTVRVKITGISRAADMIIQNFETQVWNNASIVYDATTSFGFFTAHAMAQQVGIRDAQKRIHTPNDDELARAIRIPLAEHEPLSHENPAMNGEARTDPAVGAALPARAYRMLDEISMYVPDGGPHGLGFIRGTKRVDPEEWFFKAHFYQDPVVPGSLGLEAFLQLLKAAALHRWGSVIAETHRFQPILLGAEHQWKYRGQVIPRNRQVTLEAVVTDVQDGPTFALRADGFLQVDGTCIYEMIDFGLRLVPKDPTTQT